MRIALYAVVGLLLLIVAPLCYADLSAMFLSIRGVTSRFDITRNTGANFSFSADHFTATELTNAPTNSNYSAFTTLLRSDTKRVFEITIGTASSSCGQGIGVASSTEINGAYLGHGGSNSLGIYKDGGTSINNASVGNTGITFGPGDVIDIIDDPSARTIQEVKNHGAPSAPLNITALNTQNVSPAISLCAINDSMTYNGNPSVSYSGAVTWDAPAPPASTQTPMISGVTASPGNFTTPSTNPVETLTVNCSAGSCAGAVFSLPSGATAGCTAAQVAQNSLFTITGNNLNAASTINGTPTENVGIVVTLAGASNSGTCYPLVLTGTSGGPPPPATFVANFSDVHQTIDGFGGSDAWRGDMNPYNLDAYFCINATDPGCSGPGIGLSLLREGIDTNDNGVTSFFDTVPDPAPAGTVSSRTAAAGALARGVTLFATPWVVSDSNQASAAQGLANWAAAQAAAGVPIYAMTTGNEVDCCSSYPFFPNDTANFVKILGPKLHGMSVKLISPEVEDPANFSSYISAIEGDPTANAQVDIFSTHQYGCGILCMSVDGTRHVWATEVSPGSSWDPSISNAMNESMHWVYDSIATVGLNGWNYWELACGNLCDNGGLAGDFSPSSPISDNIPKRYYAVGNWSKFVRPGWVRVGVTGSAPGIYPVAFKDPVSGNFAIVVLDYNGSGDSNVTFGIQNATISGNVTPYVTSGTPIGVIGTDGNLSAGSASSGVPSSLVPNAGVFTSTVPYGVTTFVGTAR